MANNDTTDNQPSLDDSQFNIPDKLQTPHFKKNDKRTSVSQNFKKSDLKSHKYSFKSNILSKSNKTKSQIQQQPQQHSDRVSHSTKQASSVHMKYKQNVDKNEYIKCKLKCDRCYRSKLFQNKCCRTYLPICCSISFYSILQLSMVANIVLLTIGLAGISTAQ